MSVVENQVTKDTKEVEALSCHLGIGFHATVHSHNYHTPKASDTVLVKASGGKTD